MERKRKLLLAKMALVVAVPIVLWAYEYGPDVGHTGAPNENGTCNQASCHVGSPVNGGGGGLTVNFPNGTTYVPGVKQQISITISDAAQKAWGFELTARLASNPATMEGNFASVDANTQVMCGTVSADINSEQQLNFPGSQTCPANLPQAYIEHSLTGYNATKNKTPGSGTYTFTWTPPSTNVGNIIMYVAGNAANGDVQVTGDHIYTQTYTLTPTTASNNPSISEVDNGFSTLPNSPLQAGNWVVIKGTNLSNTARGWNTTESNASTFPTSMDGVSVTINGRNAYPWYISQGQLNVQAPTDAALGPVSVVVTNNGLSSTSATAQYQPYSPALLQWNGGGFPYALITRADGAYIGNAAKMPGYPVVSAKANDILTLWVTGLGPTNPITTAGQQPTCPNSTCPATTQLPTITVGGVPVTTVFVSILRYAGLYQVNIQLPASLPTGDQPIKISMGSYTSPDGVLINIQ